MATAAFMDTARAWGRALEDREAVRSSVPIADARKRVARRTGISPGTLENLRNGRLKAIGAHVFERIREAVVADLNAEMARLEHELAMARTSGLDARDDDFAAAAAALEKARALIGGSVR